MEARGARVRRACWLLVLLACVAGPPVKAGGPRAVNGTGDPMKWATGSPVVYNVDPGPLGLLSNAQARALLAQAFAEWDAIPGNLSFAEGTPLPLDVNAEGFAFSNPAHYLNFYRVDGDGVSPVIFDQDGSIIDALFGVGARFEVLGVAGLDNPIAANPAITGASIIINGAFYDGVGEPDSPEDVTPEGLRATMVHEIGHMVNLDHTVLNHEVALDDDPSNDIYVPTMFPVAVLDEGALATVHLDDRTAFRDLYAGPGSGVFFTGQVSANGVPVQGANVVFRDPNNPLVIALSSVSGGYFFPCNAGSFCDPCTTACDPGGSSLKGQFSKEHMPPVRYQICVEPIDVRFSQANDTFVGPLASPPILTGPEECYSPTESDAASTDDPDDATTLLSTLDVPLVLNALPLPGEDSFEPNDSLAAGATLDDLASGRDTAPGFLASGDLDVFNVPVIAGQRLRVDLDASELGSPLDAIVGLYDASNNLVALSDDAVDPDSGRFSRDPAIELAATFTGTAKVVVSAFPDLDQNGAGGGSTGGYWIRVETASDTDSDGTTDARDVCPADPRNDTDRDGRCFSSDNCPTTANTQQIGPARLNASLVAGGDVDAESFIISPEGSRVVFAADQDTDQVFELYSAAIGGGIPAKLNGALVAGGDVSFLPGEYLVAPNSSFVVYRADQQTDGVVEVYSVGLLGGSATRLNGALVSGGSVIGHAISANTLRVVYHADQDTNDVFELYSVPINGGASVKLNGALTPGGNVLLLQSSAFLVSPDGSTVVYAADQDADEVFELFSVPITGGASTRLNGSLVSGGDITRFFISPDSAWVVYRADETTDEVFELHSVPIGGGARTRLNGTLVSGGDVGTAVVFTTDGSRVVYGADQDADGVSELYSVPIAGGATTRLNGTLAVGGNVMDFSVSPDGSHVVYRADAAADEVFELYGVPVTGAAPIRLSGSLVAGGDVVAGHAWSADGFWVVYQADQDADEVMELYRTSVTGGGAMKLNGPLVAGGDVSKFRTAGERVFYGADQDSDGVSELYSVPVTGGAPVKLSGPLVTGGAVSDFSVAPNGSRAVYHADQETNEVFEIYSVDGSTGGDVDGDGILNACDICSGAADAGQTDTDGNGLGDACQSCATGADPDGDEICTAADNCVNVANAGQQDFDLDGAGDACDADDDNDGLLDVVETNTGVFAGQSDTGTDPLDGDTDNDGLSDGAEVQAGSDPVDGSVRLAPVPFGPPRTISTIAAGVYRLFAADLDGDGDQDLLSASWADDKVAYYENLDGRGAFGSQQVIGQQDMPRAVYTADLDHDGDLDVLAASSADSTVAWYPNLSTPGAITFGLQQVISSTATNANEVIGADLDGDGWTDVVACAGQILWYRNTDGAGTFGPGQILPGAAESVHSIAAADVDGDGDLDLFSAQPGSGQVAWHQNLDGAGTFGTEQVVADGIGAAWSAHAADMDGDGDIDFLTAAWTTGKVNWYENDGTPGEVGDWAEHVVEPGGDGFGGTWAVGSDLDQDGDLDVLVMKFTKLVWHENIDGMGTFGPLLFVSSIPNYDSDAVIAADVDGDGDPDAVSGAANTAGNTNRIAWHENRRIHSRMEFAPKQTVYDLDLGVYDVAAGDLDGDGDLDAVSASVTSDRISWHRNMGGTPISWTTQALPGVVDGPEQITIEDLDRDGDRDVVTLSYGTDEVVWYENDGAVPLGWTRRVISTTQDGVHGLAVADLDGDGDPDIAASSWLDAEVNWFANDGTPADGGWIERSIFAGTPPNDSKRGLASGDLDGDGDIDLLAAHPNASHIRWYRNDGTVPSSWTEMTVSTMGGVGTPNYVSAGDVNGDGHLDVIVGGYSNASIGWYQNDGSSAPAFTWRPIPTNVATWFKIRGADFDNDGDLDLVGPSLVGEQIDVWENDGAPAPVWTLHVLPSPGGQPISTVAADVDSDGDMDLVAGIFNPREVAIYENRGGQFALELTSLAPTLLADGASAPLISIALEHGGRPQDSPIELARLDLLLIGPTGSPLSSDQANRLIERLRVHVDDGSSTYDPGIDPLVARIETLELSPQVVELVRGDPRLRVPPGGQRLFFVVADLTAEASASGVSQFRLLNDTRTGRQGRDAVSGALLRIENPGLVGTDLVNTGSDSVAPFVTSIFPANETVDVSPSTSVVLYFSEHVDPASAVQGVALYSNGLKVPAAIAVKGSAMILDPDATLAPQADYRVEVTAILKDLSGNPAQPFTAGFDTAESVTVAEISAEQIGEIAGGATVTGTNADDNAGFATAALGDVNGTAGSFGIADLIIGAPNADAGAVDAGKVTLVFGATGLQSNAQALSTLIYRTAVAQEFVGEAVAYGGDLNGDTVQDFLIGAPRSDRAFPDAGMVYLVFGNPGLDEAAPATFDLDELAACATANLCGVVFQGAAAGEMAGASLSWAGDVNGDGHDDMLIGAPGASPGGRSSAGKVYLLYGPFTAGTIPLSQVGGAVPGLVFHGESVGDRAGAAVSSWTDGNGDGFDDLLIGAPDADALDALGTPIVDAGYLYAIQGGEGPGRLDAAATPGVIELSRVASGETDQVAGMVFVGDTIDGNLGRSVTGAVDFDGDGVNDILVAADGAAYAIPGDDPKTRVGSTQTGGGTGSGTGLRAGLLQVLRDLEAIRFVGVVGEPLTVGAAGDMNGDGIDDFIIGSPLADGTGGADSGRAYVVLGSPAGGTGDRALADVGSTLDGFVVEGAQAGDQLGASVGGGFDLNADGVDDGLVGAPFADTDPATPANAGEAYVISTLRPAEVSDLTVDDPGGGVARLEWAAPDFGVVYNVYRGALSVSRAAKVFRTSDMARLACGITTDGDTDLRPDYDDAVAAPPPGDGWFYLVTSRNLLGEGPLGPPGQVPPRVNDLQCP